jgi:hypothetical protein
VRVAETYRGRVLSIYLMGLLAGVPFGALLEGWLADVVGLRATIGGAGALLIAYAVVMTARYDAMAPLDQALEDAGGEPERGGPGEGHGERFGRDVALDALDADPNLGAAPHVPD